MFIWASIRRTFDANSFVHTLIEKGPLGKMIPRPVKSIASIYRSWKNRKGRYNLAVWRNKTYNPNIMGTKKE